MADYNTLDFNEKFIPELTDELFVIRSVNGVPNVAGCFTVQELYELYKSNADLVLKGALQAKADAEIALSSAQKAIASADNSLAGALQAKADAETSKLGADTALLGALQAKADAETAKTSVDNTKTDIATIQEDVTAKQAHVKLLENNTSGYSTKAWQTMLDCQIIESRIIEEQKKFDTDLANADLIRKDINNSKALIDTAAAQVNTDATLASSKATEASSSATLASSKATEASSSATLASNKATEAETAKNQATTAKIDAETAKGLAETAKTDAEIAKTQAETAKLDTLTLKTETENFKNQVTVDKNYVDQVLGTFGFIVVDGLLNVQYQ